ncbi:MAG: HdeD family acid-resistance protein [Candidatus Geothermincolia bacterium]
MAEHKEKPKSTYRNLSESWKTIVAQGVAALVIGVVILAIPDLSAKVVSILLGALLIVYAILSFVGAHSAGKESQPTAWLWVRGGVAAAGGLIILFWPSLKDLGLLYVLGVFAIAVGVFIGGVGVFQKWDKGYKLIAGVGGLASIAFGVVLVSNSSRFSSSIVWIVGVYALAFGVLLVLLGMGARAMGKTRK